MGEQATFWAPVEPTCIIVRDPVNGGTNLAGLLRPVGRSDPDGDLSLPSIELRDARIRVVRREGQRDRLVEDLSLSIRGSTTVRDPQVYDVV